MTLMGAISALLSLVAVTICCEAAEIGTPHSTVITLKADNFDAHLQDPANGLWLLKFYAPWCGHCKKLAPVLDDVAPFLAGKMSIGKVDCTVEKHLCKKFDVRSYPTLKFYRDGNFQNYPLGRDADSIITFGEKMSDRAVHIYSNHDEAKNNLLKNIPVAFLLYEPAASTIDESVASSIDSSGATDAEKEIEKIIQSTELTRVFGQVARKLQAEASFGMLSPGTTPDEIAKFFGNDATRIPSGGFIVRIENDVPVKIYEGDVDNSSLTDFIQENNISVVVELGGHNFRFAGRRGKPLAIGAYDPADDVKTNIFRQELKKYAITGPFKDDYVFSTMDGKKWDKFLSQFSITKENLPELFILDVPERTFWQDPSVFGVSDFINAVKNGEIESRQQEKSKNGPLNEFLDFFVKYLPWSMFVMIGLFVGAFYFFLPPFDDDLLIPPPPPPTRPTTSGSKASDSDGVASTKKDQ